MNTLLTINSIFSIIKYLKLNKQIEIAKTSKNYRIFKLVLKQVLLIDSQINLNLVFKNLIIGNNELNNINCDYRNVKIDKKINIMICFENWIICGHSKGYISFYDDFNFKLAFRNNVHYSNISNLKIHISSNNKWLISGDISGKIIVWKIISKKVYDNAYEIDNLTSNSIKSYNTNSKINLIHDIYIKEEKKIVLSQEIITFIEIGNLHLIKQENDISSSFISDNYDEATSSEKLIEKSVILNLISSNSNFNLEKKANRLSSNFFSNFYLCIGYITGKIVIY